MDQFKTVRLCKTKIAKQKKCNYVKEKEVVKMIFN